jgi:hypothetical protein
MKKFQLDEAQGLLLLIDALMTRGKAAYRDAARLEQKAADLRVRIFHSGGLAVNVETAFRDNAELKARNAEVADSLSELEAIGVQVKDIAAGVVDFPYDLAGQTVLLCWKQGESSIRHWHALDEGFDSRRKMDARFRRGGLDPAERREAKKDERLN